MKEIIMNKDSNEVDIHELPTRQIERHIVIMKQHDKYGKLCLSPSGKYFFEELGGSNDYWDGYMNVDPREVIKGFLSPSSIKSRFFIFDDIKEFADWLDNGLNHTDC